MEKVLSLGMIQEKNYAKSGIGMIFFAFLVYNLDEELFTIQRIKNLAGTETEYSNKLEQQF